MLRQAAITLLSGLLLGCVSYEDSGTLPGPHAPPVPPPAPGAFRLDLHSPSLEADSAPLRFTVLDAAHSYSGDEFEPLRLHLEEELGLPVQVKTVATYERIVQVMAEGATDLGLLPPLAYVAVKDLNPGVEPLVQELSYGASSYSSFLLVAEDSPIHTMADLPGSRMAFVDRFSASGFLFPYRVMLYHGLDPRPGGDFAEVVFTGSHEASFEALHGGGVDVIASFLGMFRDSRRRAWNEGSQAPRTRLLEKTGRIPHDTLCARSGLPAPVRESVTEIMIRVNTTTAPGRALYRTTGSITGFVPVSDEDYDGIREIQDQVDTHRRSPGAANGAGSRPTGRSRG